MTNTQYLKKHLLSIATQLDTDSYTYMKLHERNWKFRKLKNNRLILGALRYGKLNAKDKPKYDRIKGIQYHLNMYKLTGNLEHLVDISNIAEVEFTESTHIKKHFKAHDDSNHVKEVK